MGILEGIFNENTAKTVVTKLTSAANATVRAGAAVADGAVYAAETVVNTAYNVGETAINATVNTVTQPVVTAQAVIDAARHPTDSATLLYREATNPGDPKAARAHQVVTARKLLKDEGAESPNFLALDEDVRNQVLAEPGSRGRRVDIQEQWQKEAAAWHAKEGDKGEEPKPPLVVKLSIGGSGDGAWRTHCDITGLLTDAALKETRHTVGAAKTVFYTGHKEYNWNFAGPGGPETDSLLPGLSDTGPNSIDNLVENASAVVAQAVLEALMEEQDRPIVILIKGHSRGGVAAGRVAKELKATFPDARVEVTQIDPVPGPAQGGRNQAIDVGEVDESTVVYGIYSGHIVSFTPQKVLGAKRIIISQQAHGVAVQSGFTYQGRLYKGASLNSLPPGVYRDQNEDISVAGELQLACSTDEIRSAFVDVYVQRFPPQPGESEGMSGRNWDAQRKERIEASLEEYASRLEPSAWAQLLSAVMNMFV